MNILSEIGNIGIIPVIKITDINTALPLAKALCDGGLPAAEITFRTDCAKEAISLITTAFPKMLVGAGTVLTVGQAEDAVMSGARFIVSPGLNPSVVAYCIKNGVPVIPGCATPTDIEKALELGLDTVKFFPAEAAGGLPMIKALSAPYKVKFMPTGGINEKNINAYLQNDRVLACGGSFMVSDELIKNKDFAGITALTKKAVSLMLGFTLAHIGINSENGEQARKAALLLSTIFDYPVTEIPISYFAGPFEIMKHIGNGKNGHIAVGANSVDRAYHYLKNNGIEFDESSILRHDNGKMRFVYLADEILGFAIHLTENKI
ncbi:MAG: 2-dehydro-3-deoxyphosphogluconate aldolase [Firmicutes bacterium HGW-Firmicutes-21]|nr:MAG: 2-dehydro-3-deoxyphosphogluconate aldolase [Firmicutes bacterium HGW-Firmicutes-21]